MAHAQFAVLIHNVKGEVTAWIHRGGVIDNAINFHSDAHVFKLLDLDVDGEPLILDISSPCLYGRLLQIFVTFSRGYFHGRLTKYFCTSLSKQIILGRCSMAWILFRDNAEVVVEDLVEALS